LILEVALIRQPDIAPETIMDPAHPCVPIYPSLSRRLQIKVTPDREIDRRKRIRVEQTNQIHDKYFCVGKLLGHTKFSSAPVVASEHARPTFSHRRQNFRDEA